jgi:hypothetical protein
MKPIADPILEAKRYMSNARQLLTEKAGKDGPDYSDPKYVKLAGHAAWTGVLLILDSALNVKDDVKKGERADIALYIELISKAHKGMGKQLLIAYNNVHKSMGYDGNISFITVQEGLKRAQAIIDWAEKRINQKKLAKSEGNRLKTAKNGNKNQRMAKNGNNRK